MIDLKSHLEKHDGGCTRAGKEINRLAARSGFSIEMLRSMYYARRTSRDLERMRKLNRAMKAKR